MKKITSMILTAAMCAAPAVPALAADKVTAEKITADEVKAMLFSTGLCAYPELCDAIAENSDWSDIVHPTAKVSDVIDINKSIRTNYTYGIDDSGKYTVKLNTDQQIYFFGIGRDVFGTGLGEYVADITFNTEKKTTEPGKIRFSLQEDYGKYKNACTLLGFENGIEDGKKYEMLAESINKNISGEILELAYVCYYEGDEYIAATIYVKADDNEYAVILQDRELSGLHEGEVYTIQALVEKGIDVSETIKNNQPEYVEYEPITGDEIRDTDTRAAYIGTESKFSDVSGNLVSYVNELNDLGIINGYEDDSFKPENTVTRAEAAAMIARMLNYSSDYNVQFSDIPEDAWYAWEVAALVQNGIINGTSETTFSPDELITHADMFKILVCVLGYASDFKNEAEDYRITATNDAIKTGLTKGLESFDASTLVTRGDLAIILSNALDAHMYTSNVEKIYYDDNGITAVQGTEGEDITLIDYINGGRLNGVLNAER